MSDKGYRQLENELIRNVDKKQNPIVAPRVRQSIEKQPKTQVEFYLGDIT